MSKRLRILFTIPNFNTAGSGKVVYDLVKGLDRKKFDVEIACNSNDGEFFSVVKALGLPIHIFRTTTDRIIIFYLGSGRFQNSIETNSMILYILGNGVMIGQKP